MWIAVVVFPTPPLKLATATCMVYLSNLLGG
jgi:hypothetical protein